MTLTPDQQRTPQTFHPPRLPAWVPLALAVTTLGVLWPTRDGVAWGPAWLLPQLNMILASAATILVAGLAARSVLAGGRWTTALLGAGMLAYAAASALGGISTTIGHTAEGVAIFNLGACFSGASNLLGALLLSRARARAWWSAERTLWICYGASVAAVGAVAWAAYGGMIPPFFAQQVPTDLRRAVLCLTTAEFGCASAVLLMTNRRWKSGFLGWYALGLALMTVGFAGVSAIRTMGSPLGWAATLSMYVGLGYLITAAIGSVRKSGKWNISFGLSEWDGHAAILDDHLLRMLTPQRLWSLPAVWRYALAVLFVVAATSLRLALLPSMGTVGPYNVILIATILATVLLGIGPGLLTMLLGDIAVEVFITQSFLGPFSGQPIGRLAVSVIIGVFVCWIMHAIRFSEIRSRESEERLRALYASMTEGVALHEIVSDATGKTADYRILEVNPAFEKITGISREQAAGALASGLYGTGKAPYLDIYSKVADTGNPVEFETTFDPMGKCFHISVLSPTRGRFATVFQDITERKQAEAALRESEVRFRALAETSPVGLSVTSLAGKFLYVNTAYQDLFGYTFDELKTIPGSHVYWNLNDRKELLKEMNEKGSVRNYELRLKDRNAAPFWALASASFIVFGGEQAILGTITDITGRKRAEQALQDLNDTLEQRVAERTAEALQLADQLRALAVELSQTEQRERKRLATILHDHIQQLLVAAQMHLSLVKRADKTTIESAVQGVESIIKEAIEASRSLTVELSPPILHQAGLVAALSWLANRLEEKSLFKVRVRANLADEPDSEPMRFLLFESVRELLLNAVKHSGVHEADVTMVRLPGGWTKVVIEDRGAGFDPGTLKSRKIGGFGMFSIQQRLAHIGGRMEVETAPGRGTRVVLSVPAGEEVKAAAEHGAAIPAASPEAVRVLDRSSRIRVLLVDDHKIMRQGLLSILNFESDVEIVGEAGNGIEAVDMARKLVPDVVVMDINMPGMNGIEATQIITKEMPHVRVIGLSMHIEPDLAIAMQKAGAVGYLSKGGPSDDLIAAIRTCMLSTLMASG